MPFKGISVLPGCFSRVNIVSRRKMVADFYEVEEHTIEHLLEEHGDELKYNGDVLSKGKQLKEFKLQFAPVINVASKPPS